MAMQCCGDILVCQADNKVTGLLQLSLLLIKDLAGAIAGFAIVHQRRRERLVRK